MGEHESDENVPNRLIRFLDDKGVEIASFRLHTSYGMIWTTPYYPESFRGTTLVIP